MASVSTLGRRKFMSVAALADVLKDITEYGMPERGVSRRSIKRTRDDDWNHECHTPYGMVVIQFEAGKWITDGQPAEFWKADPRATLYHFIRASPKFEAFIRSRLALHPCDFNHPWTAILYNDEITPGATLKHHNQRKVHGHYWSFVEFGIEALCSEFLWFVLHIVRSDFVASMNRGAGQIFKHMILAFADCSTEGFQYGDIVIWFRVGKVIADLVALQGSLDVKGHGGSMCCLKCTNVVSKATFARMRRPADKGFVSIAELDVRKHIKHDDNSMLANALFLDETSRTRIKDGDFKKLEIALGLVHAPDGVLLNTGFNVQTAVCLDYQHTYFVNGIFNVEAGLLLDLIKDRKRTGRRIVHTEIHSFFEEFTWPQQSKHGNTVFEKRSDDGGTLACSASEALGCFALLQYFLSLRVFPYANDLVKQACVSYYALCKVIEALCMTARGSVTPDELKNLIIEHLELFKAAYGEDPFKPKFHFATHLPEQLARWRMLLACWTHERKHKEAKRYLDIKHNRGTNFDAGVVCLFVCLFACLVVC